MKEIRQDVLIGISIAMLLVLSGTTWWLWERVENLAANISILTTESLDDAVMIPSAYQFWRTQRDGTGPKWEIHSNGDSRDPVMGFVEGR